ncbi:MarR family winged helix-turn-helix transcriptional regulator [Phytomonospora sp. NPDC050363]|uniref:MarR family winged helix-turn-helix transcriptional regulator n=1 Tax=Phytomonospora sp. NPDC050363 TaxID=3155642 RepID=UPI0033E4D451
MDFTRADALNTAIRTIAIRHRALAASMLAELGLHPGHEVVLLALDAHGPQTQKQLAAEAGCEPPSITVMVRKLETAGLVERVAAADDARARVVSLTGQGRELIEPLRRVWVRLAEETVEGFDEDAVRELLGGLELLAGGLRARGRLRL